MYCPTKKDCMGSRVQGFKGSGVQDSILVPGLHLGCVFAGKASASSGLIQNLKPNWQLFGEISIFYEDFGSSMPSLFLTLNVEPWTCERLQNFYSWSLRALCSSIIFQVRPIIKQIYKSSVISDRYALSTGPAKSARNALLGRVKAQTTPALWKWSRCCCSMKVRDAD